MGYVTTYVINMPAIDFLRIVFEKIEKNSQTYEELAEEFQENDFLEFDLFGEYMNLDYSEEFTFIRLYIKYSWFIMSVEARERVHNFERELKRMLKGHAFFFRVDDSMIENYRVEIDSEFWYQEKGSFERFSTWIVEQEELHWKQLFVDTLTP